MLLLYMVLLDKYLYTHRSIHQVFYTFTLNSMTELDNDSLFCKNVYFLIRIEKLSLCLLT